MTAHDKITEALLRHAAAQGMTLEQCCNSKFMDRKLRTLKRHVRRIGDLTFPDYTPRKLRPKKERKREAKTDRADGQAGDRKEGSPE